MENRIGIGYDIHRLVEERALFIGGVEIPYIKGLLGHSDADVLLHAICDALLGAMAEPDIGELFPDTDPQYHNVSSMDLLRMVAERVGRKGFCIANIDTVVVAQEPKLSPFKKQMQKKIAEALSLGEDRVAVKAKTSEGVGEIGKEEAICAYAVVLLNKGGSA